MTWGKAQIANSRNSSVAHFFAFQRKPAGKLDWSAVALRASEEAGSEQAGAQCLQTNLRQYSTLGCSLAYARLSWSCLVTTNPLVCWGTLFGYLQLRCMHGAGEYISGGNMPGTVPVTCMPCARVWPVL